MKVWDDIPVALKMAVATVAVVMSAVAYLSTYQTDLEAQEYQQYNNQQISLFRVQQIEAMIAQYRYDLLSSKLSPEQREWILAEIRRLEEQIACIREGTC